MLLTIQNAPLFSWPLLFLVISAFSLILAILISKQRQFLSLNWPIIALLVGFSLVLIQYVMFWTGNRQNYPYIYFFDTSFMLLFGPFIYVYVLQLFREKFRFSKLHYLPAALLFGLDLSFLLITEGYTDTASVRDNSLYAVMWQMKSPWVGIMSLFLYYLLTLEIVTQSVLIKGEPTKNSLLLRNQWARYILNFFLAFIISYSSYYILSKFDFFNPNWDYAISIVMSVGICGIGYMTFREQQVFNGELFSSLFLNKKQIDLTDKTKTELFQILLSHIEKNRPYLAGNLRLIDLADQLNLSPHVLSQIINEKAQKNFNQFINEYRLDEAIELLKTNKNESVKTICYQVGFNNKTTFYKTFKEKYGCTPSEYKLNNAF